MPRSKQAVTQRAPVLPLAPRIATGLLENDVDPSMASAGSIPPERRELIPTAPPTSKVSRRLIDGCDNEYVDWHSSSPMKLHRHDILFSRFVIFNQNRGGS
jgi:hypothetical protein